MKADHFGFALFLVLLLVVPKLPMDQFLISVPELPTRSSISFGFLGLVVWALLSPAHLLVIRRPKTHIVSLSLVGFAIYAFLVSMGAEKTLSMAYGIQYLFYVLMVFLLVTGYMERAIRLNQVHIVVTLFSGIGLIFAGSVIVSFFTGPIYAGQQSESSGLRSALQYRGIGFASGVNMAGVQLLPFAALPFAFVSGRRAYWPWLFFGITFLALLLTLSRGAIIGFVLALSLLMFLMLIRSAVLRRGLSRLVLVFYLLILLGTITISMYLMIPSIGESPRVTAIVERLGLRNQTEISVDLGSRIRIWDRSWSQWQNTKFSDAIFGQGFRGSNVITVAFGAWAAQHNVYLSVLQDFGLIGLVLFAVPLFGLAGVLAFRILTERQVGRESFAFLAVVSILIANMSGGFLYSPIQISLLLITVILYTASSAHARSVQRARFTPIVQSAPSIA